ncbi:MAG: hypothetical protein EOP45_17420 [Sphingobacteriaceae bacterium]|nr:MAG: hypothetical protein EOP45_17420 [Sphingobacteriaceae bacterium]
MLKVKSEDCPALASILFGLSVLAIFTGAVINQLPSKHHNIVTFITSLLSVASIITLYYVHRKGNVKQTLFLVQTLTSQKDSDPSFMVCMVLMGIQSFMSTPINCLVDGFYSFEISTRETQSTVIGCSSGVGYLSAAITAFLIKDQITTKEGWLTVFRCQMCAGTLMLTLLSIYILLRPVKYK